MPRGLIFETIAKTSLIMVNTLKTGMLKTIDDFSLSSKPFHRTRYQKTKDDLVSHAL